MKAERPPRNRNTLNLLIDSAIFVAFLVATAPRLSGIAVHEWLSIAFAATVVAHLLLHWRWIVSVTAQLFRRATGEARLNYALNALLFVAITVVMATGLLISQEALPLFGVRFPRDGFWRVLHRLSSDASVLLIGLHVALHWRWIVNAAGRLLGRRRAGGRALAAAPAAPQEVRR